MLRESIVRFARVLLLLGLLAAAAACDSSGSNTEGPETPEPPGTPPVDCDAAIDFEDACGPYTFADFGGGVATVIDNPDPSGINTSDKVTQMQKFAGEVFGGSALALDAPVDWTQGTAFTMKVWASRPADVLFKLEGLNQERSNVQSGSSSWEELCFDFADATQGEDATDMTVIFDLGTVGDAADDPENWTFYFDGITQTDACEESDVAYELVFADEFDSGTAPSGDKWTIETGYGPDDDGWGNNEWQLYTPSPDNVRVEDGNLVISAQCLSPPCESRDGSITSGKINSLGKFEFKFGRVEARIKPPVGKAAWPAFWSLGTNFPIVDWPRSGEIDFMELHNAFSNERTTHFTMHWCDESVQAPGQCSFPEGWVFNTQNRTFPESLGDDFHIFEAEWDESKIIGKIDGLVYFTKAINPETMEEFLREFYLILNVAMGGTLGSNNQPPSGTETYPQTMLVDYVRVYKRAGEASGEN